jgi:hypothetical protein
MLRKGRRQPHLPKSCSLGYSALQVIKTISALSSKYVLSTYQVLVHFAHCSVRYEAKRPEQKVASGSSPSTSLKLKAMPETLDVGLFAVLFNAVSRRICTRKKLFKEVEALVALARRDSSM